MAERYPHLLPHERRIWKRFVDNPPFPIDRAEYDVRLGEGMPINPEWPPAIQHMARVLTQKRVDVIVQSGSEWWLIEIKRRAGFSALGQLLGYAILWIDKYPARPSPRLAVVCESLQPDLVGVLAQYSIAVFLV